ncbi:MAG: Gfo/Idh/MocA family oxidoreductase [Opitutaceae bacterium]|nr:Gfo/Idh/MocA family oxidoreductase [Opitutaceae bacterium]
MSPPPLRFAIASPGRWGRKLLDAARASPWLRLAGVSSRTPATAAAVAAEYGGRAYGSYAELLADPAVEAVILPTPHFLHQAQATAAMQAGKHVFVEKPMATTVPEAEAMLRCARETGRVLAVGHQGRHTGGIRRVRAMIADGDFGEIAAVVVVQGYPLLQYRAAGDWRTGPQAPPGGQLDELGVHYFDVLQFLFGPVRRVAGLVQRPAPSEPPTTAVAALHFDGGIIASYTTYASSVGTSRLIIFGSKGALEMNRMGEGECTWQPVCDLARARSGGLPPVPRQFEGPHLSTTALTAELEDFARAVREGRPPAVGAAESLSTLRIARAVMEASATGRTIEL